MENKKKLDVLTPEQRFGKLLNEALDEQTINEMQNMKAFDFSFMYEDNPETADEVNAAIKAAITEGLAEFEGIPDIKIGIEELDNDAETAGDTADAETLLKAHAAEIASNAVAGAKTAGIAGNAVAGAKTAEIAMETAGVLAEAAAEFVGNGAGDAGAAVANATDGGVNSGIAAAIDTAGTAEFEKVDVNTGKAKKKRGFGKAFVRITAIVLVFFVAVMGTSIWLVSSPASATKFKIERKLYQLKDNFFSTNDSVEMDFTDENSIAVTITEWDDIETVKALVKEIPIPHYIPNGYSFSRLLLTKYYDDEYQCIFEYSNNNDIMVITVISMEGIEQSTSEIDGVVEVIDIQDRTVIVMEEYMEDTYSAEIIIDDSDAVIRLLSTLSIEETKIVATEIF